MTNCMQCRTRDAQHDAIEQAHLKVINAARKQRDHYKQLANEHGWARQNLAKQNERYLEAMRAHAARYVGHFDHAAYCEVCQAVNAE